MIDKNTIIHNAEEHLHSAQRIAPSGAAPVALTSGGGAWTLGNFSADIIAADAVTFPFDIHWALISAPDTNADYEVVLYYGAADAECARLGFTRVNANLMNLVTPVQTIILPALSRVRAKMMDSMGGQGGANIKILYHVYD